MYHSARSEKRPIKTAYRHAVRRLPRPIPSECASASTSMRRTCTARASASAKRRADSASSPLSGRSRCISDAPGRGQYMPSAVGFRAARQGDDDMVRRYAALLFQANATAMHNRAPAGGKNHPARKSVFPLCRLFAAARNIPSKRLHPIQLSLMNRLLLGNLPCLRFLLRKQGRGRSERKAGS